MQSGGKEIVTVIQYVQRNRSLNNTHQTVLGWAACQLQTQRGDPIVDRGVVVLKQVNRFKHLESVIKEDGGREADIQESMQVGQAKWRKVAGTEE